jgi:hypothetical protein
MSYVVVRGMIWQSDELAFATERLLTAALAAFLLLDAAEAAA